MIRTTVTIITKNDEIMNIDEKDDETREKTNETNDTMMKRDEEIENSDEHYNETIAKQ